MNDIYDIGKEVRLLRDRSPYQDLRTFSKHACMSAEGLRKIEAGERLPSADTLKFILSAVLLPPEEIKRLNLIRDMAHARREGLLDKAITDKKIDALANTAHKVIESYLAEFDMAFEEEDSENLRQRIRKALEKEIRG